MKLAELTVRLGPWAAGRDCQSCPTGFESLVPMKRRLKDSPHDRRRRTSRSLGAGCRLSRRLAFATSGAGMGTALVSAVSVKGRELAEFAVDRTDQRDR